MKTINNPTIFNRVEKDSNYTVVDNNYLRNPNLSWRAKGLMTYILSLPNDWKLHKSIIQKRSLEGQSAFRVAWSELEAFGYIKRYPVRKNHQIGYWCTEIHENPDNLAFEFPMTKFDLPPVPLKKFLKH